MNFSNETLPRKIPIYLTAVDPEVLAHKLKAIAPGGSVDEFLSEHNGS